MQPRCKCKRSNPCPTWQDSALRSPQTKTSCSHSVWQCPQKTPLCREAQVGTLGCTLIAIAPQLCVTRVAVMRVSWKKPKQRLGAVHFPDATGCHQNLADRAYLSRLVPRRSSVHSLIRGVATRRKMRCSALETETSWKTAKAPTLSVEGSWKTSTELPYSMVEAKELTYGPMLINSRTQSTACSK